MHYLDYNATAPMKRAVRETLWRATSVYGNASSIHGAGRAARAALEGAREQVAAMVRTSPARIVFTSGGTEANNMALHGWGGPILIAATAHDSILACTSGLAAAPVDQDGLLRLDALEQKLSELGQPALLAVMLVNNETGVIQPMEDIVRLGRKYQARIHCDAVQAAGKIPLDFMALGVDTLSLSAHKIGGPQGAGALVLAEHVTLEPLLRGGGQEQRRRAGTENVAAMAGFGQAAALIEDDLALQPVLARWRDDMESAIQVIAPDVQIPGAGTARVANTSCIIMPGVRAATQLIAFDLAGLAVSSGAACSSGKVMPSHVLRAMGYDAESALSALRISLGWASVAEDIAAVVQNWEMLYDRTCRRAA